MNIPRDRELLKMRIDYKVGDIVEAWAIPTGGYSINNGQKFEVLEIMIEMVKAKRITDGYIVVSIYKERFRLVSECRKCIYVCKQEKKCSLFMEEGNK